jgi:hypothetical protein
MTGTPARCCASATTSTAADLTPVRMLEATVFREILKPLTAGLGPLAEAATAPIADKLAGIGKR